MNRKVYYDFFIVIASVLVSISILVLVGFIQAWKAPVRPALGEIFFLSQDEIKVLKAHAREGDWVSAALLQRHYSFYAGESEEAKVWEELADRNLRESQSQEGVRKGESFN